VELVEISS